MAILALHKTLGVALLGAMLLALATAGAARADSASITFTDASGRSDPAVGVGRTLTVSGNSAVSKNVYVLVRPAGGAPCAPSASSDASDGSYYGSFSGDSLYGTSVNGNFTLRRTGVWDTPGTFQFCIWLASSSSAPVTPFTQIVTFRRPTGTISATVSPISPMVDQTATVTIAGSSEAPKQVFAKLRPAGGAPCAISYSADSGDALVYGVDVNGAFTVTQTTTPHTAVAYLICLWLADSASDGAPVAGPARDVHGGRAAAPVHRSGAASVHPACVLSRGALLGQLRCRPAALHGQHEVSAQERHQGDAGSGHDPGPGRRRHAAHLKRQAVHRAVGASRDARRRSQGEAACGGLHARQGPKGPQPPPSRHGRRLHAVVGHPSQPASDRRHSRVPRPPLTGSRQA